MIRFPMPLARFIENALPRPALRPGATGRPRRAITRFVLCGRFPNPTADYYFSARLAAPGMPPHHLADIREGGLDGIDPDGAFVILCRYASRPVLDWIETHHGRLSGVGLFLDDNIPAIVTGHDADLDYRIFLYFRALSPLSRLNRHLDVIWASTPALARALGIPEKWVLPPAPPEELWRPDPQHRRRDGLTVAYHATASHLEEHRFLRPVIGEVLRKRPQVRFEVYAGRRAKGLWRGQERVSIRQPSSWPEYIAETRDNGPDIMLVPLTPSAVNDCRSPTKRIDIARAGAAGLFSASEAYGYLSPDGEILLPYEQAAWRDALLALIDGGDRRRQAIAATRAACARMGARAKAGFTPMPQ